MKDTATAEEKVCSHQTETSCAPQSAMICDAIETTIDN